jgi:hypothetical protein
MNDSVIIDGKTYNRYNLQGLDKDPHLRNLARRLQETTRPELSRTWIGSAATKSELIDVLLGAQSPAELKGEAKQRDTEDHQRTVVSGDGKNGSASQTAAQLLEQVIAVLQHDAAGNVKQEQLEALKGDLLRECQELIEQGGKLRYEVEVYQPDGKLIDVGRVHKTFPKLRAYVNNREHCAMIGMAGTGKTHAAKQAAESCGLRYSALSMGPMTTQGHILGWRGPNGDLVRTAFRDAYEFGGVILLDEFDAGNEGVGTCVNQATANDCCGFPDGLIAKHTDFVCLLSMNTYGRGADRVYVGRQEQDGAVMDRFAFLDWPIDELLELDFSPDREWTLFVQKVRAAVMNFKWRYLITPRASFKGGKMLKSKEYKDGILTRKDLEAAHIWKGMKPDEVTKVRKELGI